VAAVGKTYRVLARRWARGWELHIEGVGVTQSRSLADAEEMVRDYVALDLGIEPHSFHVEIMPEVGSGLDEDIAAVRAQIRAAEQAMTLAAERSRAVVRALAARGLSGKDTARVLGVSPQRVSQLIRSDAASRVESPDPDRDGARPSGEAA
jgi:DNA-directed RNA polymerase specialized sigma24 family protein